MSLYDALSIASLASSPAALLTGLLIGRFIAHWHSRPGAHPRDAYLARIRSRLAQLGITLAAYTRYLRRIRLLAPGRHLAGCTPAQASAALHLLSDPDIHAKITTERTPCSHPQLNSPDSSATA